MNDNIDNVLPWPGTEQNEIQCGTKVFYSVMLHLAETPNHIMERNNHLKKTEFKYLGVTFKLNEFIPENAVITSDPGLAQMMKDIGNTVRERKKGVH